MAAAADSGTGRQAGSDVGGHPEVWRPVGFQVSPKVGETFGRSFVSVMLDGFFVIISKRLLKSQKVTFNRYLFSLVSIYMYISIVFY